MKWFGYLKKEIKKDVYVPEDICSSSDENLADKISNSLNPKLHLNGLKELGAEFIKRAKKTNYPIIPFNGLETVFDSPYLRHDKHGAMVLGLIGSYYFKFNPKCDDLKFDYLIMNIENLNNSQINAFYREINSYERFEKFFNECKNLDFNPKKGLFAIAYGHIYFEKIKK